MRRNVYKLLVLPALYLSSACLCPAQKRATLTSVEQVNALTNPEAAQSVPVEIEATVTYVEPQDSALFIEQEGHGIYVSFGKDIGLLPGDRVAVHGVTDASFRAEVNAASVQFLRHGALPAPQPADYKDLIQAKLDSRYIVIHGHVLAAAMDQEMPKPGMRIEVQVPQGLVTSRVAHPDGLNAAELLDTDIALTGVAGGAFDSRMQMAGVWMDANSAADLVIEHRPANSPWDLPLIPMDQVIYSYRSLNESQRVKVAGTLTYYEPGALAVVERDGLSMFVETGTTMALHPGRAVEVTGFPAIVNENVRLVHGQLEPMSQDVPEQPQHVTWESAAAGKYAYNLVSMDGEVVAEIHDSRVDLFIIRVDGHLFSATMRHDSSDADLGHVSVMPEVGSHVRATGVCFMDAGNHWRDRLWFDLRMRSLADIAVLQKPSWWTIKRLAYISTFLSVVILLAVIWAGLLDRRLRRQSAVLARQSQEDAMRERRLSRQEQQRSRILELISSSAPLTEVLREIREMVSSRLFGASCWFELHTADGSSTSQGRAADAEIVYQEIFSPEGVSQGFLLAAPLSNLSGQAEVTAAMVAGARLAELAIETRRLYSDLRHRSEHDLLTDIPNRFSMEKHLDQLMASARHSEAVFGLIYVDLDHFKQVNDRYGHRTGDLYLQEVTRRMRVQLRNGDVLARIGGDEFIALVPILRDRSDAEEIADRLEHCFDEPFILEDILWRGSASVGLAVYPEDGATKEELQRSADVAMYAHKQSKRERERMDREELLRG